MADPNPLRRGTHVIYHGSVVALHGRAFVVDHCGCPDMACTDRYELDDPDTDETVLHHVRRTSITGT